MAEAPVLLPLPSATFRLQDSATCLAAIDPDSVGARDEIPESALRALASTSKNLWPHVQDGDLLALEAMSGAMSNRVYSCHWLIAGGSSVPCNGLSVLLRLYGTVGPSLFCRREEAETFGRMAERGVGPRLLAEFPEGRLEEYIHGQTLSAKDLRESKTAAKIAEKMQKFHQTDIGGSKKPQIWNRLRRWLKDAIQVSSARQAKLFRLPKIKAEIDLLESVFSSGKSSEIVFCHNDLQYGNIMKEKKTGTIHFIDYEYAGFNPREFDIGNFFCELAADYHSSHPHLLDYGKYPDYEERFRFVNAYLRSGENGFLVQTKDVENLVESAEKYVLLSHLHWGLWGIISSVREDINFDCLSYARQRFEQYEKNKWKVLGLSNSFSTGNLMNLKL